MVLTDHLARHGRPPTMDTPGLIKLLQEAGLTGRDSFGRPAHSALADAVAARRADGVPVVHANTELGEPASRKDTALLWMSPHLVLDGLQLAAAAVGAQLAQLCVGHQPSTRLRDSLRTAIASRAQAGIDLVPTDVAGVSGPFPGPADGAAHPVLAENVETLAHIALIARYGAASFRNAGTLAEPGTMLCTVCQPDGRADVVEVAIGATVSDLVILGGTQAVLAGGYHGTWLPAARAAALPLSNAGLREAALHLPGASVGAGVLAALPADRCGLAETSRVARYLAAESQFGAARFVHGALGVFGEEVRLHRKGRCCASSNNPFLPVPLPPAPATGGLAMGLTRAY